MTITLLGYLFMFLGGVILLELAIIVVFTLLVLR